MYSVFSEFVFTVPPVTPVFCSAGTCWGCCCGVPTRTLDPEKILTVSVARALTVFAMLLNSIDESCNDRRAGRGRG